MTRAKRNGSKAAARAWLKREGRLGSRAARLVIALGLAGTAAAIGQAFAAATILARGLSGAGLAVGAAGAFAALALLRAALSFGAERAAFAAGAASRRRLRNDALARLLHAGPAVLRSQHSGELAALVVDRA